LQTVTAKKALFIKLGPKGSWEKECIEKGILMLGYQEVPHDVALAGEWERARGSFTNTDPGTITRHIDQVRQFYEEPDSTIWVTFYADCLWWCHAAPGVTCNGELRKTRHCVSGWSCLDINNQHLLKGRLSGKLLAVQSFQGTVCLVRELSYLVHKLNGTNEPRVAAAQAAVTSLIEAAIPIIKNLHPKDFETFVDLIFRQAGWQRTGVAGGVERDIDLDLLSPITQERIAVQVKSKANMQVFRDYQQKFQDMQGFSRFYFVTHSPNGALLNIPKESADGAFIIWDGADLASLAVRNGLIGWLVDRAS
jgi:hypothetical protein